MKDNIHCTGCGLCAAVCPVGAITMMPDRTGFLYPRRDTAVCTKCGLCDRLCDKTGSDRRKAVSCFAARASDDNTRALGSSGGMFPLLAKHILGAGGCVFGASLCEDGSVRHIRIDSPKELSLITRTKYVQSDLSGIWDDLRAASERSAPSLFCGTPCQTAAVRNFLGEKKGSLILADIICNGVPSPGIWKKYRAFLKKRYGGDIKGFMFRDKRAGDSGHSVSFTAGGKEYAYPLAQDPYCLSYMISVNIRESCLCCEYSSLKRAGDITIGDFWGIDGVFPGFDDGMGCSVVLCGTGEGEKLWERIKSGTEYRQCQPEEAANDRQPRLRTPVSPSKKRGRFLRLYGRIPFPIWIRLFGRKKQKPL